VVPVADFEEERFLVTVSRSGQVKRTELAEYANVRSGGIIAAGLDEGDEVLEAFVSDGGREVVLASRTGQAIRFEESEVRSMGRSAKGVKGMDLADGDEVVSALLPRRDTELLAAGAEGYGKRVPFTELRLQGRAGKGSTVLPGTDEAGELVGLLEVYPDDRVVWELGSGELRETAATEIPARSRSDAALRIIGNLGDSRVVEVHPVHASPRGAGGGGSAVDDEGEAGAGESGAPGEDAAGDASASGRAAGGQGELELES